MEVGQVRMGIREGILLGEIGEEMVTPRSARSGVTERDSWWLRW